MQNNNKYFSKWKSSCDFPDLLVSQELTEPALATAVVNLLETDD